MPLKAIDPITNKIVFAWEVVERKEYYICPHCKKTMFFRYCEPKRANHFYHTQSCDYEVELESEDHVLMKKVVAKWLKHLGYNVKYEERIGNYIADVLFYNDDYTFKAVVEVQASDIPIHWLMKKMLAYAWSGYKQLWIFHSKYLDNLWKNGTFSIRKEMLRVYALVAQEIVLLDPYTERFGIYDVISGRGRQVLLNDKYWDYIRNTSFIVDKSLGIIKLEV